MSVPDVSVIVPCYNRMALLSYSLESVRQGRQDLIVEVIVVDDGSETPLNDEVPAIKAVGGRIVRQSNQGLLFARLRGLAEARGRYVLFLDSDDLISVGKLSAQVAAMDTSGADISYTDTESCVLGAAYDELKPTRQHPLLRTTEMPDFCITVQPAPHSPLWRGAFVHRVVREAIFPPNRSYNAVAEIWFYHNAAPLPGRVIFVPDEFAVIGQHPGSRLTNHWEKLAVASLAVMEAFALSCPANTSQAARARQLVAQKAFGSWRWLPRGFPDAYNERLLAVWRHLDPRASIDGLGGRGFRPLARVFGPVLAARLIKLATAGPYASCRTMTDEQFAQQLRGIPTAPAEHAS